MEEVPTLADAEFNWGDGSLSPSEWQMRVAQAIKEIEDTNLEKVVLARDLKINSHRAIDPKAPWHYFSYRAYGFRENHESVRDTDTP